MAFCINCGQELAEGAKFCANCGKSVNDSNSIEQRKTIYDGEVHKCPNCGEVLESFVTTCTSCGYELRGAKTNSYIKELSDKLEKAETNEQKIDLITHFYIPNTKEDIYEFCILASSYINAGGYGFDAWYAKLEQAYQKAKISFGNSPEFEYIKKLYVTTKMKRVVKSFSKKLGTSKAIKSLLICLVGLVLLLCGPLLGENGSLLAMMGAPVIFCGFVFLLVSIDEKGKKNNKDEDEEDDEE